MLLALLVALVGFFLCLPLADPGGLLVQIFQILAVFFGLGQRLDKGQRQRGVCKCCNGQNHPKGNMITITGWCRNRIHDRYCCTVVSHFIRHFIICIIVCSSIVISLLENKYRYIANNIQKTSTLTGGRSHFTIINISAFLRSNDKPC